MKNTGRIAAGLLVLAGLATAAPQAHAHGRGGGDAFVGGLVGGLVGGAVAGAMVDAYGPPPPPPPPMYYRPAPPPMAYYAPPPPPPPTVVYGPYGGPGRPYY